MWSSSLLSNTTTATAAIKHSTECVLAFDTGWAESDAAQFCRSERRMRSMGLVFVWMCVDVCVCVLCVSLSVHESR